MNCFRCIQEVNVIEEQVNLRDEACQSVMAVILLVLCATQADEAAANRRMLIKDKLTISRSDKWTVRH